MAVQSAIDIVFTTDRFNCSQPRPDFINDCCYGDDLAAWLADKLRAVGCRVDEPGQEDWGWYLYVSTSAAAYLVAIGGMRADDACLPPQNDQRAAAVHDLGEWQVTVMKRRTLWQKLTDTNRITLDDWLVGTAREIVVRELDAGMRIGISGEV